MRKRRGRPLGTSGRLVPLTIMVSASVKQWLERVARDRQTSAGQVARAILTDTYSQERRPERVRAPGRAAVTTEGT